MYLDALSFLEDERDGFRAYEALDALTDEELDRPVEAAGGWSGRDLMGHMVLWQEAALTTAKELAVNETSPTKDWLDAEWDKPGVGDRMNEEGLARFRALPMAEVRRLFHETAGELRGYLTVVPESRWIKHADHQNFFFSETSSTTRTTSPSCARSSRRRADDGRRSRDGADDDGLDDDAPLDADEAADADAIAGADADETLDERVGTVLEELDDVTRDRDGDVDRLSVGGRMFGVVGADLLEVGLDPAIAKAALRTPDTRPSPRGDGWIAFTPATTDRFALDRAEAWVRLAYRRASGGERAARPRAPGDGRAPAGRARPSRSAARRSPIGSVGAPCSRGLLTHERAIDRRRNRTTPVDDRGRGGRERLTRSAREPR